MKSPREDRKKKEKIWMAAIVVMFALMILSVSLIVAKAVGKGRTEEKAQKTENQQTAKVQQSQPEENREEIDDQFFEELLKQAEENANQPETEEVTGDTETENVAETEESTEEETEKKETEEKAKQKITYTAEEVLAQMNLAEKVAQMFIITPEALTGYGKVTAAGTATKEALKKYPVGGLIYHSQNLVNPEQTKEMTENIQNYSMEITRVPLFLAVDEEGGKTVSLAAVSVFGVEKVPDMQSIGESGDAGKAYEAGKTLGAYLCKYGINVDFAPVVDVLTNPDNQVIGERAFGSDPQLVSSMGLALADGLQEEHVLACMKHFPGHGGVAGDSHSGAVSTDKFLDDLAQVELVPFQAGIDHSMPFIMVGHISAHNVTGEEIPSSVSKIMITDVLRGKMGYQGIVITDAMEMGAITDNYDSASAAVLAIEAGADMILMPQDFSAAFQGVIKAVETGKLSEERLNESVSRILSLKIEKLGNT